MKKSYEMDMCHGPVLGKLLLFTLPLMLSGILQLLFNAADIIVVGKFAGSHALAAVGSTNALINLFVNVFIGFSISTNVLVGQYFGAKDTKNLHETVHTSILLAAIGGVILIAVGFFLSRPVLIWMDTPADVIDHSVLYIQIYQSNIFSWSHTRRHFKQKKERPPHKRQSLCITSLCQYMYQTIIISCKLNPFLLAIFSLLFRNNLLIDFQPLMNRFLFHFLHCFFVLKKGALF